MDAETAMRQLRIKQRLTVLGFHDRDEKIAVATRQKASVCGADVVADFHETNQFMKSEIA